MIHELYYKPKDEIILGSFIEKNLSVELDIQPKAIKETDVRKPAINPKGSKTFVLFQKR